MRKVFSRVQPVKNVGVKKKKGHKRSFLAAQLIRLTGNSDATKIPVGCIGSH